MCRLSFPAPRFEFVEAWRQVWNPPDFVCTVLLWYHWYHGTFNYGSAIKSQRMQGLEDFTRLSNHILNLGTPLTSFKLSSWNIEHERKDRKELMVMASHCRRTGSNMFQRILSWCHDLIGISGMCAECATAPCHFELSQSEDDSEALRQKYFDDQFTTSASGSHGEVWVPNPSLATSCFAINIGTDTHTACDSPRFSLASQNLIRVNAHIKWMMRWMIR